MRILVTGSRDWADERLVHETLDDLLGQYGTFTLVEGGCPTGADKHAADWVALHPEVPHEQYPADWSTHDWEGVTPVRCYHRPTSGRCPAAGPRRNQLMCDLGADLCVAFSDDLTQSRGTKDCSTRSKTAGIPVVRVTT